MEETKNTRKPEMSHSREFGAVSWANSVLPDGRLGISERRKHFELQGTQDGKIDLVLAERKYFHQDGKWSAGKDVTTGWYAPRSQGIFENQQAAEQYVRRFVADYNGAEREHQIAGIEEERKQNRVEETISNQTQELARQSKPTNQLTNQDIVSETRDLHAHFQQLAERYEQAPASQRSEIREEMKPLVNRERELREEYAGRVKPELSQDRVPEHAMGFSR